MSPALSSPAPFTEPSLAELCRTLLTPGRICELSGSASSGKSTLALDLCLAAMRAGGVAAWIDPTGSFWPAAALEKHGALHRLLVVKVPDGAQALRAADMLLLSPGAVAFVVVHLPARFRPSDGQLFRLQRLAEKSGTALLMLDERPAQAPSLGASIAVRAQASRVRAANDWSLQVEVMHHKTAASGRVPGVLRHTPERLAPAGTF